MLVVAENAILPTDEPTLELWSLAGKTVERIGATRIYHPISDLEFSPEGTLLVAVPQLDRLHLVGSGPVPPVLWFDLAAGLREPPAQSAYRWSLEDACFSPDGTSLTVLGRSATGQRHHLAIDVITGQPTLCLPLDGLALTAIHPLGTGIVQRQRDPRWFRDEDDSTVRRSPSRRPMPHAELIVAHDDRWLVARDHVIESATRMVRHLNSHAIASVSGGRWILAARTDDIPDRRTASLPFLRHYYRYEGAKTQFVLIDPATGQIVRSSTWQRTLGSLAVSRDGRVLATSGSNGQILIWDVPL
jgi:WD40 repeat protein